MRYLTLGEVLELYSRVMEQSGGGVGICDLGVASGSIDRHMFTNWLKEHLVELL